MYGWRYEDRGGCNCCGCLTLLLVLLVGLLVLSAIGAGR